MTKIMINTAFDTKVSILANTYHFEYDDEQTVLRDWFDDFQDNCILAKLIEDGYCSISEKGISAINYAFDRLCEELEIEEDVAWTDFSHWNSQFKD